MNKVETRVSGRFTRNSHWRANSRANDEEVQQLTKHNKPGDRVYFDPGPGLRISGTLKDYENENLAVIEVDSEDRAFVGNKTIMKVPVMR